MLSALMIFRPSGIPALELFLDPARAARRLLQAETIIKVRAGYGRNPVTTALVVVRTFIRYLWSDLYLFSPSNEIKWWRWDVPRDIGSNSGKKFHLGLPWSRKFYLAPQ